MTPRWLKLLMEPNRSLTWFSYLARAPNRPNVTELAFVVFSCYLWSLLLFDRSWPFLDSGDVAGSEVLQHSRPSLGRQMPAPGIVRLDVSSHIWMNVRSVHSIPREKWILKMNNKSLKMILCLWIEHGILFFWWCQSSQKPKIVQVEPPLMFIVCLVARIQL